MTVKEIFKLIMLNDNVEIIDQKNYYRYWSGEGKHIPLRYSDYEVKHIYNSGSELVIAIYCVEDKGGRWTWNYARSIFRSS